MVNLDAIQSIPSIDTKLTGLLGTPLGHTLSPAMQMSAFRAIDMDTIYLPFNVEENELEFMLKIMPTMRFMGLNVTMPYKKTIMPFMDELDESARLCGSVNTIVIDKGRLIGHNTDGSGFVRGLVEQASFEPSGKTFLVLGSGGAARGISFALAQAGARNIVILNRKPRERNAVSLADEVNRYRPGICSGASLDDETVESVLADIDCVINTTPVGMEHIEQKTPFDVRLLSPRHVVCDIVYKPNETPLLKHARSIGCRTLEGYWMLVYQGALAWQLWTGLEPAPVEVMAETVRRNLN